MKAQTRKSKSSQNSSNINKAKFLDSSNKYLKPKKDSSRAIDNNSRNTLDQASTLRTSPDTLEDSFVYSEKVLREYIEAGSKSISKIWLLKSVAHKFTEIEDYAKQEKIPLSKVSRDELIKIAKHDKFRSLVAQVAPLELHSENDFFTKLKTELKTNPYLSYQILLPVNIEDPRNLGAMMRSAYAFGIDSILITNRRSAPITDTVVQSSAGSAFKLDLVRIGNVVNILEKLKKLGFWIYGTDVNSANTESISTIKFDIRSVVLMGNEGSGLSDNIKKHCDFMVHIPCKFNSLNVSVATGVVLSSLYQGINKE